MSTDNTRGDATSRIAFLRERSRQKQIIRELSEAGIVTDESSFRFFTEAELESVIEGARLSGLQGGWIRSTWQEIEPELSNWLSSQSRLVSGLNGFCESGHWFLKNLTGLQKLWDDLYFYAPDGCVGYLVNFDSERGFEFSKWG